MTKSKKILQKNLQQLEREFSGGILPQEKLPLLRPENSLSRVSLNELEVEHLRSLIDQGLGRKFLIPPPIEIMRKNPLAGGDCYDGDLLGSLRFVKKFFREAKSSIILLGRKHKKRRSGNAFNNFIAAKNLRFQKKQTAD